MTNPNTAAGLNALVDSIVKGTDNPPITDVKRVRLGLKVARDALGKSAVDRDIFWILEALHRLLGAGLTQEEIAHNASLILESAEALVDYYGPADAEVNCDAAYDARKGG